MVSCCGKTEILYDLECEKSRAGRISYDAVNAEVVYGRANPISPTFSLREVPQSWQVGYRRSFKPDLFLGN